MLVISVGPPAAGVVESGAVPMTSIGGKCMGACAEALFSAGGVTAITTTAINANAFASFANRTPAMVPPHVHLQHLRGPIDTTVSWPAPAGRLLSISIRLWSS